jgi:prepilin peptidase CpaA
MTDNAKLILFSLLIIAVCVDQKTRKIPNALVLVGLITAFLLNTSSSGMVGFKQSLTGALIGLLLLPFFALRLLGAGDVKLMAAVGAFLGATGALYALLFTMMAGGLLAVAVLLFQGRLVSVLSSMKNPGQILQASLNGDQVAKPAPKRLGTRLPYSWAILLGTLGSVYTKS